MIRLLMVMVMVLVMLQQRLECAQVPLEPQWRAKQAKPQRPKLVQVALAAKHDAFTAIRGAAQQGRACERIAA